MHLKEHKVLQHGCVFFSFTILLQFWWPILSQNFHRFWYFMHTKLCLVTPSENSSCTGLWQLPEVSSALRTPCPVTALFHLYRVWVQQKSLWSIYFVGTEGDKSGMLKLSALSVIQEGSATTWRDGLAIPLSMELELTLTKRDPTIISTGMPQ